MNSDIDNSLVSGEDQGNGWSWINVPLAVVLLVSLGLIYGSIQIYDEVAEGDTQAIDEWVVRSFRRTDDPSLPIGPSWLRESAIDATALGSFFVLTLVTTAVVGFLLLHRRRRLAIFTLIATIGGGILIHFLKLLVLRDRPSIVPHLREVITPSFPSGHAALSATVFLTLGLLLAEVIKGKWSRIYCFAWALLITLIVGLSRVYLGVHYPSDVLAGWMIGLTWALLSWAVIQFWPFKRGKREILAPDPPASV